MKMWASRAHDLDFRSEMLAPSLLPPPNGKGNFLWRPYLLWWGHFEPQCLVLFLVDKTTNNTGPYVVTHGMCPFDGRNRYHCSPPVFFCQESHWTERNLPISSHVSTEIAGCVIRCSLLENNHIMQGRIQDFLQGERQCYSRAHNPKNRFPRTRNWKALLPPRRICQWHVIRFLRETNIDYGSIYKIDWSSTRTQASLAVSDNWLTDKKKMKVN